MPFVECGVSNLSITIVPPQTPIYSNMINFPSGSLSLILPFVSGIILAPLNWIFGPIVAWNLAIAMLLFGYGVTTTVLSQQLTRSWSVGFFVGSVVIATHISMSMSTGQLNTFLYGSSPLFIASLWKSLQSISIKWALYGYPWFLIALDSPYHLYTPCCSNCRYSI